MLRRARSALLLSLWIPVLAIQTAHGQSLRPQAHPNHYIILVDAAVESSMAGERRHIYETVLLERLASALYRRGLGPSVPAYDPQQDYLTLYHFGVVTGDATTAYTRLAQYDLLTDYVHPIFSRQKGVGIDQLKGGLFPEQTYQYTILTWAKQLALYRSRPERPDAQLQRTFIVMIHDGRPNEHTVRGEMGMVRNWAGPNYPRYLELIESIDRDYHFTDGGGSQAPAWSEEVSTDLAGAKQLFFMEAYEVVSVARAEWEAQANRLRPLDELAFNWTQESGDSPRGVLSAAPTGGLAAWLRAAQAAEVSLQAAGGDETKVAEARESLPPRVETPVTFQGALTCEPRTFEALLRARVRRDDPMLGGRTVEYEHRSSVVTPPTLYCSGRFAVWATLVAVAGLMALMALGYYLYYRRMRATHLELLIPGLRPPLRLERVGRRHGYTAVVPQEGLEALSLRLPGRLKQRLLYRGATVTFAAEGVEAPLRWSGRNGPAELRLPQPPGLVPAYWSRLPAGPSTVTLSFRQKKKRADVVLTYPRALADSDLRSPTMHENSVYVALDLGSESMAAYYEDLHGHYGMIEMQKLAKKLPIGTGEWNPELLPEAENGNVSPRLWNRITFRDNAQPTVLEDDHARLHFVLPPDGEPDEQEVALETYNQSLFNFFHGSGGWPLYQKVMPNPKILFQQQVSDIMMPPVVRVRARGGGEVRLEPETLIKHLTLQVINNFVLNSAELSRFERRNINLTITVPNVYSLPHAESIREFVRENIPELASVEVLSESDAVTFYALKGPDDKRDDAQMLRFKDAWIKELKRSNAACFVTMDVGKGTTDLSCILVQEPPSQGILSRLKRGEAGGENASRRRHTVQGKTGKTSGGTYLNYLFARHYDARLAEVIANIPPGTFDFPPCGLLKRTTLTVLLSPQAKSASALEALIDSVKRSMTDDYGIDETKLTLERQRELAAKVIDEILTGIDPSWATSDKRAAYEAFRAEAIAALLLPPVLALQEKPGLLQRLAARLRKRRRGAAPAAAPAVLDPSAPSPSALTVELKRSLEGYVRENVGDLLESLNLLVKDHQELSGDHVGIDSSAFFILSGQGSLFKPLRAAVVSWCEAKSIGPEQRLMLKGVDSKVACSMGVINFWLNQMQTVNAKELHGTYGCMDFGTHTFTPFDMNEVNSKGESTVPCKTTTWYHIVYTPRSSRELEDRESQPRLNDGSTAKIGFLEGKTDFTLKYDPERLQLSINGKPLTISSFGQADSSIYTKVWPEILEPSGN